MADYIFHLKGELAAPNRGATANKKHLQFSVSVLDGDETVFTLNGLRVGAGRLYEARSRNNKGNYYSVVEFDEERLVELMQPVFVEWGQEHPDVEFPKKHRKLEAVQGVRVSGRAQGKVMEPKKPSRPFPRPSVWTVEVDPESGKEAYVVEAMEGGSVVQFEGEYWVACGRCGARERVGGYEEAQERRCPKCGRGLEDKGEDATCKR